MEIGPGGLDLSPFARMIYKHPDGEVHFVQLNVNVAQRQLPLRLAVALPVQILPDLVVAMERQGFTPAEVKGGYGYRPKEEDAEDNPLLVVGVHTKDIVYDRYPRMPDTSWAERAYFSGALDPSLGQAFSFPSLLQLRLRIEVPLWRDLTTAKHPNADLPAEEDSASDATGSAERSPRLALPAPVGLAEPPEVGTDEATEDEDMMAEPNYTFCQGIWTLRHRLYPISNGARQF